MDEQLILDAAEAAAPALRALAREILQAEAAHPGVPLDGADGLLRRAEGTRAAHVTAAADQMLEHLAAIEGTILPDQGILAVLACAGAQLLVSGIEPSLHYGRGFLSAVGTLDLATRHGQHGVSPAQTADAG